MARANLGPTSFLCALPLLSSCVTALLVEDCPRPEGATGTVARATCFDAPVSGPEDAGSEEVGSEAIGSDDDGLDAGPASHDSGS
jgi:hypothetical protein